MNGESTVVEEADVQLRPCLVCGRTFLPEPLRRHAKICAKLSTRRRRVFDSSKQRAVEGTGPATDPVQDKSTHRSQNWKEKHQQLISTIRHARRRAAAETKPTATTIPSDYKQCPGCERYFSPRVAENHITWCRSKLARIPPSPQPGSSEAMERLKARTHYKPPAPTGSLTRRNSRSAALSRPSRPPAHRMVHSSPAELETSSPHRSYQPRKPSSQPSPLPPPKRAPPIKFKERFPNHSTTPPIPISHTKDYDPYHQADLQMKNLLESTSPTGPRTVPGKRVPTGLHHNNWATNGSKKDKLENEINLLQLRISELADDLATGDATSPSSLSKSDANNNKYNGMLPDVTTRSHHRLPHFCHQCGTRYPILTAKFCCECGYRRQVS